MDVNAALHTVPGAESACFWEAAAITTAGVTAVAGGGCVNDVALVGYLCPDEPQDGGFLQGTITTFSGTVVLGRYGVTSRYKQWNPFTRRHEDRICYLVMTPDRRVFTGRNGGYAMVLKTRRSKSLTTKMRARLGIPLEAS